MVPKKVAIVLLIIALLLFSLVVYTSLTQGQKASVLNNSNKGVLENKGSGKVGIEILPPYVEDKGK